jgi:hypothetical protein
MPVKNAGWHINLTVLCKQFLDRGVTTLIIAFAKDLLKVAVE